MGNQPVPFEEKTVEKLQVKVYEDRKSMGAAAARNVGARLREILKSREEVAMVFAAAPSQNEFLAALVAEPGIDWSRVNAFHLDEYIGLPASAPQRFSNYLKEHVFDLVPFKSINLMGMSADPEAECERYSALLAQNKVDIACIGIGENGHIAFNDPPVADFNDAKAIKAVELEQRCREQQVHDGCFAQLSEVPTHALTMTIPAIMAAEEIHCMVPGPTKTAAVEATLNEPISTECPASILRTHQNARLYLDKDAAGL